MTNESWLIRVTTLAIDAPLGDSSEKEINLNLVLRPKICVAFCIFL